MNTYDLMMVVGWVATLASWFPKKWFIKNDETRIHTNLYLSGAGFIVFIVAGFIKFVCKVEGF